MKPNKSSSHTQTKSTCDHEEFSKWSVKRIAFVTCCSKNLVSQFLLLLFFFFPFFHWIFVSVLFSFYSLWLLLCRLIWGKHCHVKNNVKPLQVPGFMHLDIKKKEIRSNNQINPYTSDEQQQMAYWILALLMQQNQNQIQHSQITLKISGMFWICLWTFCQLDMPKLPSQKGIQVVSQPDAWTTSAGSYEHQLYSSVPPKIFKVEWCFWAFPWTPWLLNDLCMACSNRNLSQRCLPFAVTHGLCMCRWTQLGWDPLLGRVATLLSMSPFINNSGLMDV